MIPLFTYLYLLHNRVLKGSVITGFSAQLLLSARIRRALHLLMPPRIAAEKAVPRTLPPLNRP
jgi:hypothetical protein